MKTEFDTLFSFLARFEPEVRGHASNELSEDLKEKLEQFAKGHLSASERGAVIPILIENEEARLFLVDGLG